MTDDANEDREDPDLEQSLATGLRRASAAEGAFIEIDEVLKDLDLTLKKGTNGIVSISIENPRRTKTGYSFGILDYFRNESVEYVDPEDRQTQKLEVLAQISSVSSKADTRRLCSVELAAEGYPVAVDTGTSLHTCYDATALRRCFADILSRPTTGRKLQALIQRHEERSKRQGSIANQAESPTDDSASTKS